MWVRSETHYNKVITNLTKFLHRCLLWAVVKSKSRHIFTTCQMAPWGSITVPPVLQSLPVCSPLDKHHTTWKTCPAPPPRTLVIKQTDVADQVVVGGGLLSVGHSRAVGDVGIGEFYAAPHFVQWFPHRMRQHFGHELHWVYSVRHHFLLDLLLSLTSTCDHLFGHRRANICLLFSDNLAQFISIVEALVFTSVN